MSSEPSNHKLRRDVVPFNRIIHKSKFHFDKSFAASGPLVWNSLPEKVHCCDSLYTFWRQLKDMSFTQLFLHNNPLQWTDVLDTDHI